jgi:hypothetical protein
MTSPAPVSGEAHSWKPLLKALAVLAGYSAALFAACAAVYLRDLKFQGTDIQADAGMYAWGGAMLFAAVFGSVALFPTGLGLYFLRPLRVFWTILAIAALALAVTGPVCAVVVAFMSSLSNPPFIVQAFLFFSLMRVLGAPLLALALLLCACLAPTRFARWALVGATAIEGVAAAYSLVHWFILPHLR